MTKNNNHPNKTKRTLILMFTLTLLPIAMAILFYLNPQWISDYKNYGTLITPPVQLDNDELSPIGAFSKKHFSELNNRWLFIHIIPEHNGKCENVCKTAIHHSHQLWLMLNQNLMRMRRVILFSKTNHYNSLDAANSDPYLLSAIGHQSLFKRLSEVLPSPIAAGTVVLRDPLGNVMLWYNPDFDPYKVKKDLSRLFRTSRIG